MWVRFPPSASHGCANGGGGALRRTEVGQRLEQRSEEIEQAITEVEAVLRERFGHDHLLLTPGLSEEAFWFQAAVWALDVRGSR